MKTLITLFFFIISSQITHAQYRDVNWILCDSVGYNFLVSDTFQTGFSLPTNNSENISCISDESGDLLLSCDGETLYSGKNFDTITNNLLGNKSVTNGSVFLPMMDKYYLMNVGFKLSYNIIEYDSILQQFIVQDSLKNKTLPSQWLCEKVMPVKHANGRDWWIMVISKTGILYKYLLSPIGFSNIDSTDLGSGCASRWGEYDFSLNGDRLIILDLFRKFTIIKFNRCNGGFENISNYDIGFTNCSSTDIPIYGCCYSASNRYLYISTFDTILQFDTYETDLLSSKKIVFIKPFTDTSYPNFDSYFPLLGQMQRAPNGKIYVSYFESNFSLVPESPTYLSVINEPDSVAPLCDFELVGLQLHSYTNTGLPNMPNYNLGALEGSACDTLTSTQEIKHRKSILNIYPNPAHEVLNIEVLNGSKPNSMKLVDITGREVILLNQTKPNQQVNIQSLSKGIYLLKVEHSNGEGEVKKIVKQ